MLLMLTMVLSFATVKVNALEKGTVGKVLTASEAMEKVKALHTIVPSNVMVNGITVRYYKQFEDMSAAKQYLMAEYENELNYFALKVGIDSIDIDNQSLQAYIMSDWDIDDSSINLANAAALRGLIDVYENAKKNEEIEIAKNLMKLQKNSSPQNLSSSNYAATKLEYELNLLMPLDEEKILQEQMAYQNLKESKVMNTVSTTYSNGYNPTKAVDYAKKWANSFNTTKYKEMNSDGSRDCANFVSQALYEGGMIQIYEDHWPLVGNIIKESVKNWYFWDENGDKNNSNSWSVADTFFKHWNDYRWCVALSSYSDFKVGDPAGCDWENDGDIDHMIIIDGKTGNTKDTITYSAHSNARKEEPLATLYKEYPNTKVFVLSVDQAKNS